MKSLKVFIVIFALALFAGRVQIAHAQHEWDNFAIGECLILNVADTAPKLDTLLPLVPGLSYTCPADGGWLTLTNPQNGQLQFSGPYNRNFKYVAGAGGGGACQVPGDDSAWYTLGQYRETAFSKLDMRVDGGLGAVTIPSSTFAIANYGSGSSTVIPAADNFHYWLITEGNLAPNAKGLNVVAYLNSYLIGPDGPMPAPTISSFADSDSLGLGPGNYLYGSPDGTTLVAGLDFPVIFQINQWSGKITRVHIIQSGEYYHKYSAMPWAFSPNSKVLYAVAVSHNDSKWYLLQYDLTHLDQSDTPYIVARSDSAFGTEMALTGNGRIYGLSNYYRTDKQGFAIGYWYSIDSPDSVGAACHFEDTAFSSGRTQGCSIWNGVARVVHSKLQQISTVTLPSCQSSAYSFSRPDADGFPHWTFEGGNPSSATGSVVPQVLFDSAGAHSVLAVTSTGDTLMTLVAAGVTTGSARPLAPAAATVTPGGSYTLAVHLLLGYSSPNDTIGHLMQEYVIDFDTSILSLPANATQAITLPPQDEIVSARQTGGTLKLVIEDTLGTSWWNTNTFAWRDTMDSISIKFQVTKSDNWHSTPVTLALFSIDDGYGTRHDFCPEENNLLATITNASAGVAEKPYGESLVTVSPNPTPGPVTIRGAAGAITVTNVLGEVVAGSGNRAPGTGEAQIDLSKLPAGTYFVRAGTQVAKVLVAH